MKKTKELSRSLGAQSENSKFLKVSKNSKHTPRKQGAESNEFFKKHKRPHGTLPFVIFPLCGLLSVTSIFVLQYPPFILISIRRSKLNSPNSKISNHRQNPTPPVPNRSIKLSIPHLTHSHSDLLLFTHKIYTSSLLCFCEFSPLQLHRWRVRSKQPGSPPAGRLQGSSWPPRRRGSRLRPLVE